MTSALIIPPKMPPMVHHQGQLLVQTEVALLSSGLRKEALLTVGFGVPPNRPCRQCAGKVRGL